MTKEQEEQLAQVFDGLLSSLESGEGMNLPDMIASSVSKLRSLCHELGIPIHREDWETSDNIDNGMSHLLSREQYYDWLTWWEELELLPMYRRIKPDDRLIFDI